MFFITRIIISLSILSLPNPAAFANPWSLEIRQWRSTEFEDAISERSTAIKRRQIGLSYQWSDVGLSYVYQPVLIRQNSPAHNGYFHQLDLSFDFLLGSTKVEFISGIHGSSNQYKHFDFHRDALVSKFSLMHSILKGATEIGFNGDYRFGGFKLYPRISILKKLTGASEWVLDMPIALLWRNNQWQFGITRYGEKWAALDSKREVESAFYLDEWRLSLQWQVPVSTKRLAYELGAGISFDSRVRYLDLVRGWQEKDLESAVFIDLGLRF